MKLLSCCCITVYNDLLYLLITLCVINCFSIFLLLKLICFDQLNSYKRARFFWEFKFIFKCLRTDVTKKILLPLFVDGFQLPQGYRATTRKQFTFYHSVPRSSSLSFNWPWKDERLVLKPLTRKFPLKVEISVGFWCYFGT